MQLFPQGSENPLNFCSFAHKALVHFIAQNPTNEKAWREFYRRFHQHISLSIGKAIRITGHPSSIGIAEDLVQELYQKLIKKNCKALHDFTSENENGIFKYLQIIAIRVVLNDLAQRGAKKRPPSQPPAREENDWPDDRWLQEMKVDELTQEIDICLKKIFQNNRRADRDMLIMCYFLYEELKPAEIVAVMNLDLSAKRVSNIIDERLKELRPCLMQLRKG
jgi:DNA-directed RNA polymerase specialized sigma24 family protein